MAQDEILTNAYADHALANFESADTAGASAHQTRFKQSLDEEKAMAQRIHDLIAPTTRRYVELTAVGEKADR